MERLREREPRAMSGGAKAKLKAEVERSKNLVSTLRTKLAESERLRQCENRQTAEAITAKREAEAARDRALKRVEVLEAQLRDAAERQDVPRSPIGWGKGGK
jgi:membrane protein involved in colicin uptake